MHDFDHALVDAMGMPQVLPQTKSILIKFVTNMALLGLSFMVYELEVSPGTCVIGKGLAACQAFATMVTEPCHSILKAPI